MKRFTSYRDIKISYDGQRDRWVPDLRPLGASPARPPFMTKAEATEGAKEAFERWLNRGSDEEVVAPKPDITVGQCFKNFLSYSLERAHNPDEKFGLGSQQNHIDNVKALGQLTINGHRLEKMMLKSVGKSAVESVWKTLRKSVAASTASDRFGTFKQAVRHSFKNGYIAGNPCELAEITPPNLDEEKIKRTIAACAKVQFSTLEKIVKYCAPEDRLKIIFAARTGMRQGEMVALKVYRQKHPLEGGIDFDNSKIHVRTAMKHSLRRQDRYIGDPKSMAGFRNIPIDRELCDALKSYWDALPKRMKGEGYLFPSRDGTPLDGTNLRERVLYRACEAAGLPKNEWPTWHELRHAFATNYLNQQGSDFKRVMNLMGHKDMRTTLLYDHVIDDHDRDDNDRKVLKKAMPFDLGGSPKDGTSNVVQFKKAS